MKADYLSNLVQIRVIGISFSMGACSLLMAGHRLQAEGQYPRTSCFSYFQMILWMTLNLRCSFCADNTSLLKVIPRPTKIGCVTEDLIATEDWAT